MAMIMRGLNREDAAGSSELCARAAQRTFLCEYVARAEFGGAGECQVFAHRWIIQLRDVPCALEEPVRFEHPVRNGGQLILSGQIFGHSASECIEAEIAGQRWNVNQCRE